MSELSVLLPTISGLSLGDVLFTEALGGHCLDDQGNAWIDFVSGYGSVVLGHANPEVVDRVGSAIRRGTYFYGRHAEIARLRKRLLSLYPDHVGALFFKTGSEAVQSATRLARSATGRPLVLRCGFHGWHDEFMGEDISWHRFNVDVARVQHTVGVPAVISQINRAVPPNAEVVDKVMAKTGDVAALILDPVQLQEPIGDMLRALRDVCTRHRALLIVDESKTCLRTGLSGVQGRYGLFGDITILSKAIANGFPLAATLFNAVAAKRVAETRIMGTFNDEYCAIAAAHATLDACTTIDLSTRLERIGQQLIDLVNRETKSADCHASLLAVPYRWPSMPFFLPTSRALTSALTTHLAQFLATRHILWLPNHMNFVNLQHTSEDCTALAAAVGQYFAEELHRENQDAVR